MSIVKDLVSDQRLSQDSSGYTAERSYLVSKVGGTPETKLYNAITTAGIPQKGDPHPIIPDVVVTSTSAKPAGSGSDIIVTVNYSVPEIEDITTSEDTAIAISPDKVSISTSLSNDQTWFDINGELMFVSFNGITRRLSYKRADVQRPQLSVTFERIESASPKPSIFNFLGRVNSGPWSGFPAKTWLCTGITASEDTDGKFNVSYDFSYKEESWRLVAVLGLTDAEIAELPPDPDTGNAIGTYDVYKTADFNVLGLSF